MKTLLVMGLFAMAAANGKLVELAPQIGPVEAIVQAAARELAAPSPTQLTTGGCCTQPFWSADGKRVQYIDRPAGGKLGIYGVNVSAPGAGPALVSERVEDSRIVGPYRIETTQRTTTLVRLSDGKKFTIPAQGRGVQFSPDFKRIAWSISNPDLPPERQVAAIWVANADGSGARRVANLRRGGVGGWISDSALLVSGQDPNNRAVQVLSSLSIADGKMKEITRAERLRSAVLSPSGKWIVYHTAFSSSGEDGLWVVDTEGGKPKAAPKEAFGAYQWRPGSTTDALVVVPFKPNATHHEFWQLNPSTLEFAQLTKAEETPVKIANGDWRVSPDGLRVVYVESRDRNIWLVELP